MCSLQSFSRTFKRSSRLPGLAMGVRLKFALAGKRGTQTMALVPNRLRLEDSKRAEEYRIRERYVEVRELHFPAQDDESSADWHLLTPQELADHIHANSVVAQWLQRRLGWRRLLQASVGFNYPDYVGGSEDTLQNYAA